MPQSIIHVNRFAGLNTRNAPGRIEGTELIECQNYDLGKKGELTKRPGFSFMGTPSPGVTTTVVGYLQTSLYNQIIVRSGNDLYYSDDGAQTWHLIGTYGDVEAGVQYTDKFYMVRRTQVMLQWDGAAMTTIATSPTGSAMMVYKDRLYVVNSYGASANRVYYSKVADFSTAGWSALGTFIDIQPGDGDVVVCFATLHDNFYIFKMFSSWILYTAADPTAWVLRIASPEIGCVSKYTPKEIEGFLYFVGARGVYRTDGYSFSELSEPVKDEFLQQITSVQTINGCTAAWWEDRYIIQLQTFVTPPTWGSLAGTSWDSVSNQPWDSVNAIYTWMVYHLRAKGWTHWKPAGTITPNSFLEIRGPYIFKGLYMGSRSNDGNVYRLGDQVYADGPTSMAYDCIIETKDFDFETPEYVKRSFWLALERAGQGGAFITPILDGVQQPVGSLVYIDSNRRSQRIQSAALFRTWRVKAISTNGLPEILYGFEVCISPRSKTLASV